MTAPRFQPGRIPLAYCRTYPLPKGRSVEFVLEGGALSAQWLPRVPSGTLARKLLPHYREARNDFLASIGVPMLVIEL